MKIVDLNQFWQATLAEIELQVSRPNFLTWLKNSQLLEKNDGVALVALPNNFAKQWVENKYQKIVLGALRNLDETTKNVEFIVKTIGGESAANFAKSKKPEPEALGQQIFPELNVDPETNLNPRYTLNSFVVGKSNELAFAATTAVIKEPGKKYNPFFIYGGVGVGKTHLIQAIGNEIKNLSSGKLKIRYVSSEKFTNEVIWGIRNRKMDSVKDKYRLVDILIIDDIQFIGGKTATEEEFFHTFNALYESNKQVIISSDKPPRFIPTLQERLKSRFEGGMIVDIDYPDYELKVAILKTKLQERNVNLKDEVINLIANRVSKNLRVLEGIINKILFHQYAKNVEITPKIAEKIVDEIVQEPSRNINPGEVIKTVADVFGVSANDLVSRSRKQELVIARQAAMYLLRDMLTLSYPYIGEKLGKRDHTTAIYAYEKIAQEINKNPALMQKIMLIRDALERDK